jgi:hypothetical protein
VSSHKSKTALILAVVLFCGLLAGLVVTWRFVRPSSPAPDLQGYWAGSLDVNQAALRLVLKVERSPDGHYTATMDSVDQGAKDIPIDALVVSNRTVRLELASLRAGYQGELNARATELSGQWRQGKGSLPLTLRRTTNPPTIAGPLPASAYARRAEAPLQGIWKGTIQAGPVALRILFKISATASDEFTGTMDSTDQGARDIPLSAVSFDAPTARFDLASIGGHYEGTLKEDASDLDGTWTQAGKKFRLLLQRADPAELNDSAPDAAAFAYGSTNEVQGHWRGTLNTGNAKLRLAFAIARLTNGTYTATMNSLDQGAREIPASTATFSDSTVMLEWEALRATYQGQLENGRLIGFWKQGPTEFPLELDRTNQVSRP